MSSFKVGLLIVSDTASKNSLEDKTSSKIEEFFSKAEVSPGYEIIKKEIVPDDIGEIQLKIRQWTETDDLKLILTSGGTGFSDRDITPEVRSFTNFLL